MLGLFLAAHSSLFVPSKIEKRYSDLAVCPSGQPAEKGCEELERGGAFHDKRFEKKCIKLYSLLFALIMIFLIIYFSFRFYATWWCRHIMQHFTFQIILSLKSSLEVLTDTTLQVILYPEVVVLHSTFSITETLKGHQIPTCTIKIIRSHLGQSYCQNITNLKSTRQTSYENNFT